MINASNSLYNYFNKNIREEGQEIEIKISKSGKTYTITDDDLVASSVKIIKKSVSGASFDIGECYVDSATFTINKNINNYKSLTGAKVTIRIKVNNTDLNISESVLLGTFRILQDGIKRTNTLLQVTADSYISKFDKSRKRATFTGDLYDLITDSCSKCKVTFGMSESAFRALSPNVAKTYEIKKDSSLKTHRDVIMYVAQLIGGFATTTPSGELIFKNYTSRNDICNVNDNVIINYSIGDDVYNLSGLGMSVKENDVYLYRAGEDDDSPYFLNLDSNPIMENCTDEEITEIVGNIWGKLIELNLNNFSFDFNGNPLIEVGDIISIPERSLETYVASCEWVYHGKEKISCVSVDKNKRIETQKEKQNENKPKDSSKDGRVDDLIKNTTTDTRKVKKTVTGMIKCTSLNQDITQIINLNEFGFRNQVDYNSKHNTNYTFAKDAIDVGYLKNIDNENYFHKVFTLEPALYTTSLFNSILAINYTDLNAIVNKVIFENNSGNNSNKNKNIKLELDFSNEVFDIYNYFINIIPKSNMKPPALVSATNKSLEDYSSATYPVINTTQININDNYLQKIINSKGSFKCNLNYNKNVLFSANREPSDTWYGNYNINCNNIDTGDVYIDGELDDMTYYYEEDSRKVIFNLGQYNFGSGYPVTIRNNLNIDESMVNELYISGYGTETFNNKTEQLVNGEQSSYLTFLSDFTLSNGTYIYTENQAYTAMIEKEKELKEAIKNGIDIPYKLTYETEESYTTTIEGTSDKINENAEKTDENADEIEKLKTNVKKNSTSISKLKQQVTSNTHKIGFMSNDLSVVKTDIAKLDNRVTKLENSGSSSGGMTDEQKHQLEQNTTDIRNLKTNVANNTKNISTNKTNIDNLATRVSNLENSGGSGSGITEEERQQIQTNKTDIANNTKNINTNTTNITNLTTRVSNLENSGGSGSGITETERQQIQTNKTDIANLTTRVSNLENSGGSGSGITETERQQIQTNKTNLENLTLIVNGHTTSIEDILRRLAILEQGGGGETGETLKFTSFDIKFNKDKSNASYYFPSFDINNYKIDDTYYISETSNSQLYYYLVASLNKMNSTQTFRSRPSIDSSDFTIIDNKTQNVQSSDIQFVYANREFYYDCESSLNDLYAKSNSIHIKTYSWVSATKDTNWINETTGNKVTSGAHNGDVINLKTTITKGFKALNLSNAPSELNKYYYKIIFSSSSTNHDNSNSIIVADWTPLNVEPGVLTDIRFTFNSAWGGKTVNLFISDGQYVIRADYDRIPLLT